MFRENYFQGTQVQLAFVSQLDLICWYKRSNTPLFVAFWSCLPQKGELRMASATPSMQGPTGAITMAWCFGRAHRAARLEKLMGRIGSKAMVKVGDFV